MGYLITLIGSILLILGVSAQAASQSPFAGIYLGSFSGPQNFGQFGVLVRTSGQAIVAAYDSVDQVGFVNTNVTVSANGTVNVANIDGAGTKMSAQFTSTGVTGFFQTSTGGVGTFSETKRSNQGPIRPAAGYYRGTLSGKVTIEGSFLS